MRLHRPAHLSSKGNSLNYGNSNEGIIRWLQLIKKVVYVSAPIVADHTKALKILKPP